MSVIPFSDMYILTNIVAENQVQISVDSLMVSGSLRRKLGKDVTERPLLFDICNKIFCCQDGSMQKVDFTHMKQIGKDLCQNILDQDTSTLVGCYLY